MRPSPHTLPISTLAILVLAFVLPGLAHATVESGLKIRWLGDRPLPARSGHEFVGQLEVIAPRSGRLENFQVGGTGWALRGMDAPASLVMSKGQRRIVNFRAVPTDPTQPLTVRATFDGVAIERSAKLDAASLQKRRLVYQRASGPILSGSRARLGTSRTEDQQIAFMGDFRYTRGDGVVVGADHIKVKVWDDDSPDPFDEVIWSGETDANGHFEGAVSWDDCDITGCDDPDVYVEVIATGNACDLQDDTLLEATYSWESAVIDDFTGTFIDFGVMTPGVNTDEHAAVHIFNSVTRAHRFAAERAGMNAPMVDVLFPDFDDPTKYDGEEIHIALDRMWNEVSHTHEFAHHLHNHFGNLLASDYQSGFCDPGHCTWCPEHLTEGWQEGFADWYGTLVTEDYISSYGQTPWIEGRNDDLYKQDGVFACFVDSQAYPDGRTEGYVAALLRDIQDGANDNHQSDPAPDCYQDALSLGYDEILTVFRDDDPTSIGMFLSSFRARYPLYDMDLWSTAWNVGPTFGFPLPDPTVVTQPASCLIARDGEAISLQVAGNGSLLRYQWRFNGSAFSDGGGVSGATAPTLTITPVSTNLSGTFDCVVSTCDGSKSVTSASTQVTVFDPPVAARPHLTWGENSAAQCGNGTSVFQLPPGSYTGLTNVAQAGGGRSYSVALRGDGTVYTWGWSNDGEMGNGFGFNDYVPSPQAIAVSNVIQVAAGKYHVLAIQRSGAVVGWGYNGYGALGDQTQLSRLVPSGTTFPGCFVAVAAGDYYSLALRSDGTVWSCGYGGNGSLGIGGTNAVNTTPTQIPGLTDVIAICTGSLSSYALKSDGTVWAWGYNAFGNLGNGTTNQSNVPVQVSGLTNIRAIEASQYNAYAIRNSGEVYAWGRGNLGGIGNGSADDQYTPTLIPSLPTPKKIVSGDAGWAMALMQDGTVRAWGANTNNVLNTGAPDGSYQFSPQPVLGVSAVNNIGAGYVTAHVMGFLGTTAVEPTPDDAPALQLALRVTPTPSRSTASLAFDLPTAGQVSIAVYDIAGRLVQSVVKENRAAGRHIATWNGRSRAGEQVSPGVYVARLEHEGRRLTRTIVLVR